MHRYIAQRVEGSSMVQDYCVALWRGPAAPDCLQVAILDHPSRKPRIKETETTAQKSKINLLFCLSFLSD